MRTQCKGFFLRTTAVVLFATGSAKLASAFGADRVLEVADPIIGLSFRKLISGVGVVELMLSLLCLSRHASTRTKLVLVAWLSTTFLVYRSGLWLVNWHHPCRCMGELASVLHLSDNAADNIMKAVLAYMVIGSYGSLCWAWKAADGAVTVRRRRTAQDYG